MKGRAWNYVSEFLGTFLLVLSILVSNGNPIAIGGALGLVVYFSKGMSGGNVNPAVSLVNYLGGKLAWRDFLAYLASQVGGAVTCLYVFKMFA
jgi:aquaporin Z